MSDPLEIDSVAAESTPDPKRLDQLFAALSARVNTEISTYWARNNLLLVLNAGLLAVGLNQTADHPALLILAILGIITSLLLFFIAKRGRAWLRFWENRLVKL